MRNITNILLLLMCMVGFLPSCTEDDTVKERTYDLSFGFESLTEFANIGKQSLWPATVFRSLRGKRMLRLWICRDWLSIISGGDIMAANGFRLKNLMWRRQRG